MWKNYFGSLIDEPLPQAVERQILNIRDSGKEVRICIGTDSLVRGNRVNFATALVFIVVGNGGYMFIHKRRQIKKMALKERMMTEIVYSIEAAYEIDQIIKHYQVHLEIHADINSDPKFPSNVSYHEAMGYIRAMGYHFVSKPDAFASSICADRFCE